MEQVKMNEEHENTDLVDDYSKKKRILQENIKRVKKLNKLKNRI